MKVLDISLAKFCMLTVVCICEKKLALKCSFVLLTLGFERNMANQTIEERVRKIIVDQLDVNEEQVTDRASFLDDLGADSLDTVELIMAFEEEFKDELKGEIPETEAEKMRTVHDVVTYIKEKLGE